MSEPVNEPIKKSRSQRRRERRARAQAMWKMRQVVEDTTVTIKAQKSSIERKLPSCKFPGRTDVGGTNRKPEVG